MKRLFTTLLLITALVALLPPQLAAAQSGNQWQINYFPNTNWTGPSAYLQYASVLNINWGGNSPGPNVPGTNFTAQMDSDIFFYAGLYRFTVLVDDEFSLNVGGITYFSNIGAGTPGKTISIDVPISQQGTSHVQVLYRQFTGPAYISVAWELLKDDGTPAQPSQPAPPPNNPAPSGNLVTQFGDYTRCVQQNLHQSQCFQSDGAWNSPNLGSIQMEPQILLWRSCKPDEQKRERLYPDRDKQAAKCSKTGAGWFAM